MKQIPRRALLRVHINLNWKKNKNDFASTLYAHSISYCYEIRIQILQIIREYLQILIGHYNADLIINRVIQRNDKLLTELKYHSHKIKS